MLVYHTKRLHSNRERRTFMIPYKLRIINDFERVGSISRTARKYNVTRKTIRDWRRLKPSYLATARKRFRCKVTSTRSNLNICLYNNFCENVTLFRKKRKNRYIASKRLYFNISKFFIDINSYFQW